MAGLWHRLARDKLAAKATSTELGLVIPTREVRHVLGHSLHIPRNMQVEIITELVEAGMLERIGTKFVVRT